MDAADGVTALYEAHALGLLRLALVMVGDRASAEDVVQDAFVGLYRRWRTLTDTDKAISYVRSSVLNGSRTVLRRRARHPSSSVDTDSALSGLSRLSGPEAGSGAADSAEAVALLSEEHREVLTAMRRLPERQREALVLRYYLDLSEEEMAAAMGISRGTVKSTTSRALTALGKILGESR